MTEVGEPTVSEAHLWRARIDDGGLAGDEQAEFESWLAVHPENAAAFADAEILWAALGEVEYDAELLDSAGASPGSAVSELPASSRRAGLRLGWAAAASVAALAVALVAGFKLPIGSQDELAPAPTQVFRTGRGMPESFVLEDGSRLMLGPLSRVDVAIDDRQRTAELVDGDAFFDVVKQVGVPFSVGVGAARVDVTGTAFELRRRGNQLAVTVAEGEVRVSHPQVLDRSEVNTAWVRQLNAALRSVTLTAGQSVMATQGDGLGPVRLTPITDVGAWRMGQLIYVNAQLAEVVADLNRYAPYPVDIEENARALELSGTFAAADPEVLLDALTAALPVEVVDASVGKRIVLSRKDSAQP
ncbi:MAG: FecR domain-containing protein [Pseudomonadota bacterium]